MSVLTGFEGALYYDNVQVANCRNWSITVNRDALEITALGDGDRVYSPGLRGATGSATVLYDNSISGTALNFWNKIFATIDCSEDKTATPVKFVFNDCKSPKGEFVLDVFITSWSHSVSVGEVQAVTVQFQVTGDVSATDPTPYHG